MTAYRTITGVVGKAGQAVVRAVSFVLESFSYCIGVLFGMARGR